MAFYLCYNKSMKEVLLKDYEGNGKKFDTHLLWQESALLSYFFHAVAIAQKMP